MRLWSLHPRYLDGQGLIALWREALLAQAVLRGRTRGYRHHPQLDRFRAGARPVGAIGTYLQAVRDEGSSRGYALGAAINRARSSARLPVSRGQLEYEWRHLRRKLAARDPEWLATLADVVDPRPHPLFRIVPGGLEDWERIR
jgi:hypothetical protein